MPDSRTRYFQYKRARFLVDPAGSTLEALLRTAVSNAPIALDRAENPQGDNIGFRFLNHATDYAISANAAAIYTCEFIAFEKGADQSTIRLDNTAPEVDIDAVTAGEGEEFLAGGVYFCCTDNHVVLVQSKALGTVELEKYLNWLLIQRTGVLPNNNRVELADHAPDRRRISFSGIKGIEITAPVHLSPTRTDSGRYREEVLGLRPTGKAWEAVKALVGDSFDLPQELTVEDVTHAPDVQVRLYLKWKAPRAADDEDFAASIARNMRHVDDEFDYTIYTRTGRIGKEDFKIQQQHSFRWDKGRPVFDDIFPKMAGWLNQLIQSGRVRV